MMTNPSEQDLQTFRTELSGRLLQPDDPDYEQARLIWNAMIDRRPALIVQCASTEDVPLALRFAREHQLEIAVRGGGHNIAGNGICDGGLMIDLSGLRAVEVDPDARTARVQPGATLADLDEATQRHGLATPVGINSTTGVAGLTLGGGFGWLTRRHGMTVDNLLSAEVVAADGRLLHASADENADLFWGLRGGGGNFGIVTQFEFRLHPVGPEILAGLVIYPLEQGDRVLRGYRDYVRTAPESVSVWIVVRHAPPLPFLPAASHGQKVVVLAVACTAPQAEAEHLIAPLQELGEPLGSHIGMQPFVQWQKAFDPLLAPGARNYWKSHNFSELGDGVLDAMVAFGHRLPMEDCEIFVAHIGGAPNRVLPQDTAYAQRDAHFVMNVHGRWHRPSEDAAGIAWARETFAACAPFASSGVYTNFMTSDEAGRLDSAYGVNLGRLQQVKQRYDPENVFHLNPNIRPSGG
jgi:FAD/FMN-containing dehydrogenase